MLYVGLVVALVYCAVQAIRAPRLLTAALWLAGVSALLSVILYAVGANEVAVVELSVGTGLVTVLFVFAISISGEDASEGPAVLPMPLVWGLVVLASGALGWMILARVGIHASIVEPAFAGVLWQARGLDVLVQIILIFAGALGVLVLLADTHAALGRQTGEPAEPQAPERDEERPRANGPEWAWSSSVPGPASVDQGPPAPERSPEVAEVDA